jgi:hypothetical protein
MGYKKTRRHKRYGGETGISTQQENAFLQKKKEERNLEVGKVDMDRRARHATQNTAVTLEQKLGPVSTNSSRKSSTAGRRRRKTHRRRK